MGIPGFHSARELGVGGAWLPSAQGCQHYWCSSALSTWAQPSPRTSLSLARLTDISGDSHALSQKPFRGPAGLDTCSSWILLQVASQAEHVSGSQVSTLTGTLRNSSLLDISRPAPAFPFSGIHPLDPPHDPATERHFTSFWLRAGEGGVVPTFRNTPLSISFLDWRVETRELVFPELLILVNSRISGCCVIGKLERSCRSSQEGTL